MKLVDKYRTLLNRYHMRNLVNHDEVGIMHRLASVGLIWLDRNVNTGRYYAQLTNVGLNRLLNSMKRAYSHDEELKVLNLCSENAIAAGLNVELLDSLIKRGYIQMVYYTDEYRLRLRITPKGEAYMDELVSLREGRDIVIVTPEFILTGINVEHYE